MLDKGRLKRLVDSPFYRLGGEVFQPSRGHNTASQFVHYPQTLLVYVSAFYCGKNKIYTIPRNALRQGRDDIFIFVQLDNII